MKIDPNILIISLFPHFTVNRKTWFVEITAMLSDVEKKNSLMAC